MWDLYLPSTGTTTGGAGLAETVFDNATAKPDFVQLSRKVDGVWQDVTAARFRDDVLQIAKGFIAQGVRFGDSVGILASNSYEWTLVDYALWTLGVRSVPLHPTASSEQVATTLSETGAMGCVVDHDTHLMTLGPILRRLPGLIRIWEVHNTGVRTLMDAGRDIADPVVQRYRQAVTADTPASVVYTSGTNGRPKGCVLTHGQLAAQADSMLQHAEPIVHGIRGGAASTLLLQPLSHVSGRTAQVCALRGSVRLAHHAGESAAGLMSDLATFRPTFLLAGPALFEHVLDTARRQAETAGQSAGFERAVEVAVTYAEARERQQLRRGPGPGTALRLQHLTYDKSVYRRIRQAFGDRLRNAISGGSALTRELGLFFLGAGITVHEGYGLTESCSGVVCNPPGRPKFGTVGRPVPGAHVYIADDGEVLLAGDQIFSQYLLDKPPTRQVLRDGWLATGDLGFVDDEGYLTITGRKNDSIVTIGGKKVSPHVLEEQVRSHPFVAHCVAVGDGMPFVSLLVTLDHEALRHWRKLRGDAPRSPELEAQSADVEREVRQAINAVNAQVSRAESIGAFRILPAPFTREAGLLTPTSKVRRAEVLRRYAGEIRQMYSQAALS